MSVIDSQDVNLIIFDMDGTIIPSLDTIYRGIQMVFQEYGWELSHTIDEINRYVGTATGELYRAIIPPEYAERWEELRDCTRQKYTQLFSQGAITYPAVRETLETLRRRGYTLVQYSNASVMYFDTVLSSLGIRECYDYTECVHENGLTKTELIRKIRERYGNPGTAVVGDRIHDVEAARDNDSLSIGVLYGYGEEEPQQADLTISNFKDLLDIFDRRIPVFDRIIQGIESRKRHDAAFVVGITGIDCSGKTLFAEGLERYLKQRGRETRLIYLDEFLHPSKIRYSGDYRDELFYERVKQGYQYDFPRLTSELLKPVQQGRATTTKLRLFDWKTDSYDTEREFAITPDTIIIIEGVFLFIPNISPYIDLKVFLEIPFDECLIRASARDPESVYVNYKTKYQPAQREYLAEFPPRRYADIIVDNSDWEKPRIA